MSKSTNVKPRDVCRKLEVVEGDYMHLASRIREARLGGGQGG